MVVDIVNFPQHLTTLTSTPSYDVSTIYSRDGTTQRVLRSYNPSFAFDVALAMHDTLEEIREFFHDRKGSARGFLVRDETDFSTAADHIGAPSALDALTEQITTTTFRVRKAYTDGVDTKYRDLRHVEDLVVAVNGTPTVSFTESNGIITFGAPPSHVPTAGCYYRVAVMIEDEFSAQIEEGEFSSFSSRMTSLREFTGEVSTGTYTNPYAPSPIPDGGEPTGGEPGPGGGSGDGHTPGAGPPPPVVCADLVGRTVSVDLTADEGPCSTDGTNWCTGNSTPTGSLAVANIPYIGFAGSTHSWQTTSWCSEGIALIVTYNCDTGVWTVSVPINGVSAARSYSGTAPISGGTIPIASDLAWDEFCGPGYTGSASIAVS